MQIGVYVVQSSTRVKRFEERQGGFMSAEQPA